MPFPQKEKFGLASRFIESNIWSLLILPSLNFSNCLAKYVPPDSVFYFPEPVTMMRNHSYDYGVLYGTIDLEIGRLSR